VRADSNRTIRAEAILEVLRQISGEPRTIAEVARMLGRLPGGSFSMDLGLARQIALDAGEVIAPCTWDPGYLGDGRSEPVTYRGRRRQAGDDQGDPVQGAFVLYHLMPGRENGRMGEPMLTKAADAMTRVRNAGRYGKWQSCNGEARLDRKLAEMVYNHATHSEDMFRLITDISDEIRKVRLGQGKRDV